MNMISINGVPTMTSLEMVEYINSQRKEGEVELLHKNFLAKVPEVLGDEGSAKFSATYQHPQNRQTYPMYIFPKREACLMAMSYSYELQAKVFDKMTALEKAVPVMTNAQMLVAIATQAAEQEARVSSIESKIKLIESQIERDPDYFSVMGYARYIGVSLTLTKAKALGRCAGALSRKWGVEKDEVKDPRFGYVGSYREDVLEETFRVYN